jgi:GGDEF domain-containing protein
VAEPIDITGTTVTVGATIGVALSSPGQEHPDRTVRNADAAMYHAKEAGRGRYTLASTLS